MRITGLFPHGAFYTTVYGFNLMTGIFKLAGVVLLSAATVWWAALRNEAIDSRSSNGRGPVRIASKLAGQAGKEEAAGPVVSNMGKAVVSLSQEIRRGIESGEAALIEYCTVTLLPALVELDVIAATRLLDSFVKGDVRDECLRAVVRSWAAKDVDAALAWAGSLVDRIDRENAGADVCFLVSHQSLPQAISIAESFAFQGRGDVMENLLNQWTQVDSSAALEWIKRRASPEERTRLTGLALTGLARVDPAAAAVAVCHQLSEGAEQDEATLNVLYLWSLKDPARARAWVNNFPPSTLRDKALHDLPVLQPERVIP